MVVAGFNLFLVAQVFPGCSKCFPEDGSGCFSLCVWSWFFLSCFLVAPGCFRSFHLFSVSLWCLGCSSLYEVCLDCVILCRLFWVVFVLGLF